MKTETHIPILNFENKDFKEELEFNIWSTQSSSDYDNSRNRPYNGQPWTDDGKRGEQEVHGVTMRDLRDCLIKAILLSSPLPKEYFENYTKYWDCSNPDKPKPTQYLLESQNKQDYISTKVETNTWRVQDVYKVDWNSIDPLCISTNFTCEVEKLMNIFPNVPESSISELEDLFKL